MLDLLWDKGNIVIRIYSSPLNPYISKYNLSSKFSTFCSIIITITLIIYPLLIVHNTFVFVAEFMQLECFPLISTLQYSYWIPYVTKLPNLMLHYLIKILYIIKKNNSQHLKNYELQPSVLMALTC